MNRSPILVYYLILSRNTFFASFFQEHKSVDSENFSRRRLEPRFESDFLIFLLNSSTKLEVKFGALFYETLSIIQLLLCGLVD